MPESRSDRSRPSSISRRDFLKSSLSGLAAPLFLSCGLSSTESRFDAGNPRLTARPGSPTQAPAAGLSTLGLDSVRDAAVYVPEAYSPQTATPLFIALHGAGGGASNWTSYHARAETRGMILLLPNSRAATWDMILGGFGPDVEFLDRALEHTFEHYHIDPTRIALAGFSDGASYALSLGIANGDLFTHLVAFSPGFMVSPEPIVGKPPIYVSHGATDGILPVRSSRDVIVPRLRSSDYDVTYEEFDGGHQVPAAISESALDWFLGVE